jgi:hypothetical protein
MQIIYLNKQKLRTGGYKIKTKVNFKLFFKRQNFRQKLWKELVQKTEDEIGQEMPGWIKDVINNALDKYESMRNEKQFFAYVLEKTQDAKSLLHKMIAPSEQLDINCKHFLDKILGDCYTLTNGEGIKRRLWKYMNQIDFISGEVKIFDEIKYSKLDKKIFTHELLTFYERLYEITLKILIEYAYTLALVLSKIDSNIEAKKFIKLYDKNSKKGKSLSRGELIDFFDHYGYWESGKDCRVLNSRLRNAIAHFNFYQLENTTKMGNEIITIEEIRNEYLQLLAFYSYTVGESMKKTKWLDSTDALENQIISYLKSNHILTLILLSIRRKKRMKNENV